MSPQRIRHFFHAALVFPGLLLMAQQPPQEQPQRRPVDAAELERLRSDEPRRIELLGRQVTPARLGLGPGHALEFRSALTDAHGRLHVRYRQLYKGVRVMSASVIGHLDEQERYLEPTSRLFGDLDLDTAPAVGEAEARAAVLGQIPPDRTESPGGISIRSELAILPERVLLFNEDSTKRVLPAVPAIGEYQWTNASYRLVWLIHTSTGETPAGDDREPRAWIVDAASGALLRNYSLAADQEGPVARTASTGTARTTHFGAVEIATSRNEASGLYELVDVTRGGNTVLNLNNRVSFQRASAKPFTSQSGEWGDGKPSNGQTIAAEAAFTIERAWDYLSRVHRHRSLDGRGSPIEARVQFGEAGSTAAFWHRTAGAAFFGSGTAARTVTDLETVAHELGHGFWFGQIQAEGGVDSEADGIGQGNADIFAALVEFYLLGSQGRGTTLTDVDAPWNWRDRMVNPSRAVFSNQPGLSYWTAGAAALDEHAVGALYGHLFVMLARGTSSDPRNSLYSRFLPAGMVGVGVRAAAELWYTATTAYLPDEPSFFDLRTAYLEAASFLYGADSSQYAAVSNAFAAVGLGTPIADASVPSVNSLTVEALDEGEGSMLVSANAFDDLGVARVEFVAGSKTLLVRERRPFAGYVGISGLAQGGQTLLARAIDASGKIGFASAPFVIRGVNQLVADGGFEDGGTGWTASPGVVRTGEAESFLGSRHAAFSASGTLTQQLSIPANAAAATLSYRLRVEPGGGSARLEVQILDRGTAGVTLATFFDTGAAAGDADPLNNGYRKQTLELAAYRGRTLELRFMATMPNPPPGQAPVRFRVDTVSLVSTAPLGLEASAEVDDGETSLVLGVKNISGIRPSQIARVEYVLAGGEVLASTAAEPFQVVRQSNDLARRTWMMTAVIHDLAGQKVAESPPVTFAVGEANQLVLNGGFEAGPRSWAILGQTSFPGDTQRSFLGARFALLGGRGSDQTYELSQAVTIPAGATQASLSFRLRVDGAKPAARDTLSVRVFERDGGSDVTFLGSFDNRTDTGSQPGSIRGYVKKSYDLSRYAGRQIQIQFQAKETLGAPTSFLVDAVSVAWR